MAKLRIQAPDGKTLVVDVGDADPSQYDDLAASAVADYSSKQQKPDYFNEPGLESGLSVYTKPIGTMTKAGYAGLADIANPQQAAENVQNVEEGKSPATTEGKVGEFAGSLATPEQIAAQAALGPVLESVGPAAANILKGWGQDAAISAVGVVKNIAKGIGLDNLPALADFLTQPVEIGGKTLDPVVQATSTAKGMLAQAKAIQAAAGQVLGKISPIVDETLQAHPEAIDLKAILQSLDKMKLAVEDVAPELGKSVVNQYDAAISDFLNVVKNSTMEENPSLFSDLRKLKTTIGDLVYRHGNPLESKAALEDAYGALAKGIDDAASNINGVNSETGQTVSQAFDEANAVYNKISAVVDALTGKVAAKSAKGFFDVPTLAAGVITAPLGLMTSVPAMAATKTIEAFGPQALARGLGTAAKYVTPALQATLRGIPGPTQAIMEGLSQ